MKTQLLTSILVMSAFLSHGQWTTIHTDAAGDSNGLDATVIEYQYNFTADQVLFRLSYTNLSSYSSGPAADFSFQLPNGLESENQTGSHWTSSTPVDKTAYIYCDANGSAPDNYTFGSWAQTIDEASTFNILCSNCVEILCDVVGNQITYTFNRIDIISDIEMDGATSATIGLVANVGHDVGYDDSVTHTQNGASAVTFTIDKTLSTQNLNGLKNIALYPNPAKNNIVLSTTDNITSISIFDISGKKVRQIKLQNLRKEIDVSFLEPGLYMLLIQGENGPIGQSKFIKN